MKRIKSRLRNKMGNNRLNTLGILSMQKTLVNDKVKAGNSTTFYGKVLQHFIKQNIERLIFLPRQKYFIIVLWTKLFCWGKCCSTIFF